MTIQKNVFRLALVSGVVALSACSSSEGVEFSSALVDQAFGDIVADGTRAATSEDLAGEATMTGYYTMGTNDDFGNPEDIGIWGGASVTADFDNSTLSGSVTDLGVYAYGGDLPDGVDLDVIAELEGSLSIDGTIVNTGYSADLDGTLSGTEEDLGAFTIAVDSDSVGQFYILEDNRTALDGDSMGTLTIDSENEGVFVENVDFGRLVATE